MNDLITISGVRGFIDENGTAQLNLEDVARGLGFTETKNAKEYVMWRRVFDYLRSFGTCAENEVNVPEFIPENIFYRLAMKAKNETAEKFQAIVADEILPAIRKTGTYSAKPQQLTKLEILELAIASEKKVIELQSTIEQQKPKVLYADATAGSNSSILVSELAKILKQNGVDIGQNRLFEWLRENGYLNRQKGETYNLPTQKSMDLGVMEIKNTASVSASGNGSLIFRTTKITGKGRIYFVNKFLNNNLEVV